MHVTKIREFAFVRLMSVQCKQYLFIAVNISIFVKSIASWIFYSTVTFLQKPDKLLMDNTNLLYTFSDGEPETGTTRETFFCNQLASAGHKIEYGGLKTGYFRIDNKNVIEVGGAGKDYSQINDTDFQNAALAFDNIDMANGNKIPLWAFGCLY